jgi:hypothetical protein
MSTSARYTLNARIIMAIGVFGAIVVRGAMWTSPPTGTKNSAFLIINYVSFLK